MIKQGKNKEFHEKYRKLIKAYRKTKTLVKQGDIGWALFICKKVQ